MGKRIKLRVRYSLNAPKEVLPGPVEAVFRLMSEGFFI